MFGLLVPPTSKCPSDSSSEAPVIILFAPSTVSTYSKFTNFGVGEILFTFWKREGGGLKMSQKRQGREDGASAVEKRSRKSHSFRR